MTTSKGKRMPGKTGPATSRSCPRASAPEPHQRIRGKQNPLSDQSLRDQSTEGSAQPILRSQPRRLGPGSSRQARPWCEYLHGSMFILALALRAG